MQTGGCVALCETTLPPGLCEHPLLARANDTHALNLDPITGKPLRFSTAITGPNRKDWITADVVEITKLVHGAGSIKPVHSPSQKPTCYNRVVKEKMKANTVSRRVRGTAGGDRIDFSHSASSSTASMTCFKMALNDAVPSDSNLGSAGATGFYLGADLPPPQSIKMCCDTFYAQTLLDLGFTPHIKTEPSGKTYVCCDVARAMPGLGASGLLSQLRLLVQLHPPMTSVRPPPPVCSAIARVISPLLLLSMFFDAL
jgi:hypothetical protein